MKRSNISVTRVYSLLIPVFVDGMLGLIQTAVPLFAIRLGATVLFLGILGGVPQAVRVPFCLLSGALSDKYGRMKVIIFAAALLFAATVGLSLSQNKIQVFIWYSCLLLAVGAFYPSLLAFIGEHSLKGELRKNLSSFNIGWTVGGSVCAIVAGFLFSASRVLPFLIGSFFVFCAATIVILWSRIPVNGNDDDSQNVNVQKSERTGMLLSVSRVCHAIGFFGFGMIRNIFPKLGITLSIPEGTIGVLVGLLLAGQAVGMFIVGIGPWWRGKVWPLVVSQILMSAAGLIIYSTSSIVMFGAAITVFGLSVAMAYTATQYYSLSQRENMGRNSGISESLIAGGIVVGSISGGWIAQTVSLRAPYMVFVVLSMCSLLFNLFYWRWSIKLCRD